MGLLDVKFYLFAFAQQQTMMQVPDHGDGHTIELTRPNKLQLLIQTHFWRAPDTCLALLADAG